MFSFIGSCIVIVGFAAWLNSVLWYKNITIIKDNKTLVSLTDVFFFCAERPRLCDMHKAGCFLLCKAQKQGFFLVFLKLQWSLQRSCKDYSAILKSEKRKTKSSIEKNKTKGGDHMLLCGIAAVCLTAITVVTFTVLWQMTNNTIYNKTNDTKRKEKTIW